MPRKHWIISACAEQTVAAGGVSRGAGDHLRVCGADFNRMGVGYAVSGSSPRVRSRRYGGGDGAGGTGIISACAEQTQTLRRTWSPAWDHLRVCGADVGRHRIIRHRSGSSPRVRSRHDHDARQRDEHGIISACAEQTVIGSVISIRVWDHLRVCGADSAYMLGLQLLAGSSPRVRSRQLS